ncbi:hypothetical protein HMPREF3182_01197 [Megasphaera hutchinsoni]|uniref:Uncharacterized protein n=1 Tax=Megasphaera hutchinsoni TaxID=1588748 RepID=A0A134CEY1_9FIRM|nr:hypothetical protein HMPREF3182_01197 [Megasphaera hutchinsoni]MUP59691.1 hypothetical protein [Veillonellaceae bacterium M2-4]
MKYKENCVLNFNIIKYEIKRKILKIFRIQYKKEKSTSTVMVILFGTIIIHLLLKDGVCTC